MNVNKLRNLSFCILFFLVYVLSGQGNCNQVPDPCDGKTYTQGAWGAGNNNPASQYLNANFASSFPSGLTIGCGTRQLKLTSPSAIAAFLPSGSTPAILPTGTLTNPNGSYNNVLAGQLVTLMLNATFDANDPNFSPSPIALSNYTITSGTFSGMTVGNLIAIANSRIGGCSSQYSYSQLNNAIDDINNNYDNGNSNDGFLTCAGVCNVTVSTSYSAIQCNGGITTVNVSASGGTAPYSGTGSFTATAGSRTFQVADANGCQASKVINISQPSPLNASSSCVSKICYGATTNVNISASGGSSPYSGTGNFSRPAGLHSFTVTDNKGCTDVTALNILQYPELIVSASVGNISCHGGSTTVTITASGGTPPYSSCGNYSRSAGVHSFTITDSKGCSSVKTITITQPSSLTGTISKTNGSCSNNNLGSATVTASGGTAPYFYLWSNNASSSSVSGLTAGSYSLTLSDANACSIPLTTNITTVACCNVTSGGSINGSISSCGQVCGVILGSSSLPAGGIGATEYIWIKNSQPNYPNTGNNGWSGIPNSNSPTLSVGCVSVTTYYIRCARKVSCGGPFVGESNMVSVIVNPAPIVTANCNTTAICFGGSTTVNISAAGGTAPYGGVGTFTVGAGPYSFTVTDANGCSGFVAGNINQSPALTGTISKTNGSCSNNNLGSATVTASGGTAPYSYVWSNNATSATINNLAAGNYSLTLSDANACSIPLSTNITTVACCNVTSGGSINGSISSCGQVCGVILGSSSLPAGGIGATEYIWIKNSQPNYPNTGNNGWSGIPNSNSPTLSVGCVSVTTYYIRCARKISCGGPFVGESNMVSVIVNPAPIVTASNGTILCNGGTTTVNVSASDGTSPYSGIGIFTVSAGTYSYLITDASGCSSSASIHVTEPSLLNASIIRGTITGFGGTTTVNVSASGGTSPYTGTGTYTASAGTHTYLILDASGCTATVGITLAEPGQLSASSSEEVILCNGGTTTVNISASGGVPPYTGTGIFTVSAGTHTFIVTDANNNTALTTVTIIQPAQIIANTTNGTILCNGGTTTLNVSATGGTPPYSGIGVFNVSAGTHTYLITDTNGCSTNATTTVTITEPSLLVASSSNGNILCNGGTTTVNVSANGGVSPYSGTGIFTVSAGTHTYLVSDANGCSTTASVIVTEPSLLTASATSGTILSFGGSTTVNIAANGGTAPYSGVGTFSASAGTHTYLVTDANGCSATVTVTLTEPGQLVATTSNGTILCHGGTTTVNIAATGGVSPYSGIGTFTATAGTHTYLVSDANSNQVTATVTISEPSLLVASSSNGNILCNGGTTTVNVSASGGVAPYSGTDIFTVSAGTHTYLITDVNGCSATASVIVTEPSLLTASATSGTILSFGGTTTVNTSANGGTSPYSGVGTFSASAGTHTYLVTDANGCSATVIITLTEPGQLVVTTSNGTILCNGGTATVSVSASGGVSPYSGIGTFTATAGTHTYLVSDANNNQVTATVTITEPSLVVASISSGSILCNGGTTTVNVSANGGVAPYSGTGIFAVSAGTHTYLVTDANGCSATTSVIVTEPTILNASSSNGNILCNGGTTTVNVSANGGVSPYYGTGIFTVSARTHTYLITDANGCSATTSVNVTEPSLLTASATSGTILSFGGTTTVNIAANGGTAPYSGVGTFSASAGTHTYLVTDANGCSATVTVTLTEPGQLVATTSNGTILCHGGTTTVNISASGGVSPYSGVGTFTATAGTHTYLVSDANSNQVTATVTISEPSLLVASSSNGNILCNGGTTTVNVSANGGVGPYSGTGIFTVSAGTHTYLVSDANGCSTTTSLNISEPSQVVASATSGSILCNGGTTTVNVSANGGVGPYSGTGIFTVSAGTHTYLVSDANGCSATVTVTLTEPGQLVVTTSNGTILCNGGTATVSVSASGGVSPYSGIGTFTATAGTHTYLVTDANNNQVTATITITEPSLVVASISSGSILCNGGTTTVNVSASGGVAPYSGTGIFTVSAGTHTYLVTDANGCSATTSVNVTEPSLLVASSSNGNILCNGGTTTVNVSANGGTAPYTGAGVFNVSAGTHTYLLTDANGCSNTTSVIISEPSLVVPSISNGNILCNGGTTTVNISANGGIGPYSGAGVFTVSAGTHTYLVTDANGCSATTSVNVTEPSLLTASATSGTILSFGGTTTVNISANGGTSPYTGVGTFSASAGTHTYLVTDANGCSATVTVTLTEPGQLVATTSNGTILCHGGTTTVNVSATGGVAPYSGVGTFSATAGTHTYLVTDANNNQVTATVTITEPSLVVASISSGSILCNGGTTTVNVSANGGTSPYSGTGIYTVSAGTHTYLVTDANGCSATTSVNVTEPTILNASATSGTILSFGGTTTVNIAANGGTSPYSGVGTFSASAGTHTYLVTDANGCSASVTVTLTEPGQLVVTTSNGTILCHGGTTTVNVSASSGVAPYSGVGTFTATAGTHTYLVTDANNNQVTATVTITEPSLVVASVSSGTILCNGGTTTVNISANGGTSPYSGTGIFNVSAGTHTYLITDVNGCSTTASVNISEPSQVFASTTSGSILCNGGTTTVNVSASGGVSPYSGTGIFTVSAGTHTYLISDANGCSTTASVNISEPLQVFASTTSGSILCNGGTTTVNVSANGGVSPYSGTGIFTVSAGTHTYLVTDANGCSATTSVNVTEPSLLVASSSNGNILCNGGTTTVNVSASGGVAPYSGTGIFTVSAGTHTYLITDVNGCSTTTSVIVTEPTILNASSSNGNILCNGGTTTVNVSANGGIAPYTGTGTFTVSAGSPTYLVSDANGCSTTASVIVTEPSQVVATVTSGSILCNGGTTTVNISANGGTAPYSGTGIFTVSAGTHTYLVSDANGCSTTASVIVTEPSLLTASATSGTILSFGGSTTVNIAANGGTAPYSGVGTFSASAGTHTYLVTDANGCSTTVTVTLTEPGQLVVTTSNGTILCHGGTTTVTISASGGVSPYSGIGTFTATAGTHTYLVTDANNNQVTATVTITEPSLVVASATSGSILCNGGTTTVNVSANGGTAPYSGTGIFTVSAGTHTYLVTDANGCSATTSVNVTEPSLLVASSSNGNILCNGGTTTVNVSASGGIGSYSGAGVFTVSAGTHTYLVTDANGCSATTSVNVTEPSLLTASATSGTILSFGGTTTVNISANGGTAPYSGVGTFSASAGTHTYLVTDANGCSTTVTVTLTEPGQLVVTTSNGTILCHGGTTTVNVSATGGVAPYSGVGTFSASAGTHTYLVTDANNNQVTATITITEPSLVVASISSGSILCNGGTTTVNVSASGGVSPYTGTGIFTVSAGTHTYLVSDANGCSTTTSVNVTEPSLLVASSSNGNILCNGGTTTVNVSASGGVAPYSGTGIFTVSAGTHTYLITDVNGCSATTSVIVTEPTILNASSSNGNILCNGGTTTVNVSANGGIGPYSGAGVFTVSAGTHTYLVTDANGCSATTSVNVTEPSLLTASATSGTILSFGGTTTVNISANGGTAPYSGVGTFSASAGTHTYLVTDANGCSNTVTVTLTEPGQLVVTTSNGSILCNGGTTTVNIAASGGVSPYSGIGTFSATAGTHTYLVSDANNNQVTATVTITEPSLVVANISSGSILCKGGTTTVNVSANGGIAPYTGTGIFTVSAGTHTYLVSDANGCSTTTSVIVTEPSQVVATVTIGSILCNGGTTTVNVSANGGTSPYSGTGIYTVSAGTHTYLVTDANGCSATTSVIVTEPSLLVASSSNGNILCNGGTTTVNVSANGGIGPYSGAGVFTVSAGTHTYLVTDANGCSATTSVNVTEPSLLTASATSGTISSFGGSTTVNISANGGTAPYSGVGTFTASAGTHTYLVTDANGCSATVTVTLTEPGQLVATTSNGTILCHGGTTTVNVSATGGVAPYSGVGTFSATAGTHTYLVTDANSNQVTATVTITEPFLVVASISSGSILCNGGTTTVNVSASGGVAPYSGTGIFTVSAGTHTYLVTDANGCSTTTSVNVTEPTLLVASSSNGNILCNGGTTTVNVSASGGVAPYSGTGIFAVSAGTHTYLVTDANGCSATTSVIVTEPSLLVASSTSGNILCNGGTTTVNVSANGGVSPYYGTGIFTVSARTHTYLITDANGCSATTSVNVTEPSLLTASATSGTISSFGGSTTVNISANGGTSPYSGVGTFTASAGTHTYLVTDANGCSTTVTVTLPEPGQLVVTTSNGTILCHGGTTTVNIAATGGVSPYSGIGTFTATAGTHTYLVTDANNNQVTATVTITEPSLVVASISSGSILCNGGTTTVNVSANGGVGPYSGTGVFTVSAGTHTYLVTDANGCSATTSVIVTEPSLLVASSTSGNILCNGGTTTVNVSANGGATPYSGTGIFIVSAGTHTYLITDVNGCSSTTSVIVSQPSQIVTSVSNGVILCNGGTTTVDIFAFGGSAPYNGVGTFTASAGTHTYLVTDASGCSATASVSITEPTPIIENLAVSGNILCSGDLAFVNVFASGGTGPYQGEGSFNVAAGDYTFVVTDFNGCSTSATITVTGPSPLIATFEVDSIQCNGGMANATISATGGTAPYSGTGIYSLMAGAYPFMVTDNNGCSVSVSRTISEPQALIGSFIADTIKCNGYFTTVDVAAWGGTAPYSGTGTYSVLAGTYSYSVADANGCSTSTIITLSEPPPLVAGSVVNSPILCHGGFAIVTVYATGGSGVYLDSVYMDMPCMNDSLRDMLAANGGTVPYWGPDTYYAPAGSYTYGVVDSHCCWDTAEIVIPEPPELIGLGLFDTPCEGGQTTVTLTATGGTGSYTGLNVYTVSPGTYTYLVTDENNCTDVVDVFVDISVCTGLVNNSQQANLTPKVYPNPNNGTFRISGLGHGEAVILNQAGQVVREIEFKENEEIITEDLAEGMYFLVGKQWRVKIVVIRNY